MLPAAGDRETEDREEEGEQSPRDRVGECCSPDSVEKEEWEGCRQHDRGAASLFGAPGSGERRLAVDRRPSSSKSDLKRSTSWVKSE